MEYNTFMNQLGNGHKQVVNQNENCLLDWIRSFCEYMINRGGMPIGMDVEIWDIIASVPMNWMRATNDQNTSTPTRMSNVSRNGHTAAECKWKSSTSSCYLSRVFIIRFWWTFFWPGRILWFWLFSYGVEIISGMKLNDASLDCARDLPSRIPILKTHLFKVAFTYK